MHDKLPSLGTDINLELRMAADTGDKKKVSNLLQCGAEVNAVGNLSRQTALHRAASKGHFNIVMLLLKGGADPQLLDKDKKTAAQLAIEADHSDIAEFLTHYFLCQLAVTVARQYFPEPASSSSELAVFRGLHRKLFFDKKDKVSPLLSDVTKHASWYTEHLIEAVTAIEAADLLDLRKGLCGELSRVAFCFLSAKLMDPPVGIELFDLNAGNDKNHVFLVLGRSTGSKLKVPKTWGNAIVCDADHRTTSNVYTSSNPPLGAAVSHLNRYEVNFKAGMPDFKEQNDLTSLWHELINEAYSLIAKRVDLEKLVILDNSATKNSDDSNLSLSENSM